LEEFRSPRSQFILGSAQGVLSGARRLALRSAARGGLRDQENILRLRAVACVGRSFSCERADDELRRCDRPTCRCVQKRHRHVLRGVPLGPRLKTCFDTNEARMSPQCQQTRGMVYTSIWRRAAAQRNIGDACSADIARLCGTSHADAHLVECLLSVSPAAMSPQCNQTFTDTGWRTERARQ
jgi:hypothetical protein